MVNVYRVKDSDMRRVWLCDDNGDKYQCIAVIAPVKEAYEKGLVEIDGVIDFRKWLVISCDDYTCTEFDCLVDAKRYLGVIK